MIAQEISLVPARTVIENVFLGIESTRAGYVDRAALRKRYRELDEHVGFGIPHGTVVGGLRIADQQKVEILRALARDAKLIVMDEPTAALTADESEKLLEVVRTLSGRRTTIVFVSHFLEDVIEIADDVTVLRDGKVVQSTPAEGQSPSSLVTAMLGRTMETTFPPKSAIAPDAPIVLSVENLSTKGFLEDISFDIRAGEIVGLAGLVGSGRSEVARAVFGADPRTGGTIRVGGAVAKIKSPRSAVRRGIAMLPESRKLQGLLMGRSVAENITLPHLDEVSSGFGVMRTGQEKRRTAELVETVDIRTPRTSTLVNALSGGNQQKVLFAKWLFHRPRVLLADEPTRGVDVGAKRSIYELIHRLAADGLAVLLISSELEEVLGLAQRILVMRGGKIVARLEGDDINEDAVMAAAFATGLNAETEAAA
jgi:ABC-type sugar transport system ATPase subunit